MELLSVSEQLKMSQAELLAMPQTKYYEMMSGLSKLDKAKKEQLEKYRRQRKGRR